MAEIGGWPKLEHPTIAILKIFECRGSPIAILIVGKTTPCCCVSDMQGAQIAVRNAVHSCHLGVMLMQADLHAVSSSRISTTSVA